MKSITKFVGLDVSKESISVAVADVGRGAPRYFGSIPNTSEAIRKLIGQLGKGVHLEVCYEAGPTGYGLYRQLTAMEISCMVVAPSLSTLESQLGWTQGDGTNLGSNWTSTLNSDQSYYTYSVMPNPTPADVFVDTATTVGLSDIGNIDNIYGYLPGYKSVWYLGYTYHYVTGYAYSGYGYGTASSQDVTWYDESDINSYGHHITNSVATLQGLEGSSKPGLNFQGVIS
ncbi:hypothetical protein D2Q93_04450 [Alicyclobacillaceae bacterium I2511]|nr:hypothetical protein D2Q93_04450 [Alicyclobacillaceae bacterium I2511]